MSKANTGATLYADCPECGGVLKMFWTEGEEEPEMCKGCATVPPPFDRFGFAKEYQPEEGKTRKFRRYKPLSQVVDPMPKDGSTIALDEFHGVQPVFDNSELLSKALRAICFMRDYCPAEMPAIKGWEWFDVGSEIAKAIPHDEWAREFRLRVDMDKRNRAIEEELCEWMRERSVYYDDNFPSVSFDQFIEDNTLETPLHDVNEAFYKAFRYKYQPADWLIRCNVIRITDIMTEEDKAKAFDEYQIPDKDEYAKSSANKLANMTDSERSDYLNGNFNQNNKHEK